MYGKVEKYIRDICQKRPLYFILIDPEKEDALNLLHKDIYADAFLLGGSSYTDINIESTAKKIKEKFQKPLILFPGTYKQITPIADAILFMSLISGRNPRYLIGEQIKGAPIVYENRIEALSTAYILINGGNETTVQKVSGTTPLNPHDIDNIKSHVQAAILLGMRFVYLEAGSGALTPVPSSTIKAVKSVMKDAILIVGGGIKTKEDFENAIMSGADIVVTGNITETNPEIIVEFMEIIHKWNR